MGDSGVRELRIMVREIVRMDYGIWVKRGGYW